MNLKKSLHLSTFFLSSLCIGFFSQTSAFVGQDLGLDLYRQVDEGYYSLKQEQIEYEMSDQGNATIGEVVSNQLTSYGVDCNIASLSQIEGILGNSGDSALELIMQSCNPDGNSLPNTYIEQVQSALKTIKNDYIDIAEFKTQESFNIGRIGLYNDGSIDNSPFDLIYDLQEIDEVIFTQIGEYEGVETDSSNEESESDESTQDLGDEEDDVTEDESGEEEENLETEELEEEESNTPENLEPIFATNHLYVCPAENTSGLDIEEDLISQIQNPQNYKGSISQWYYPDSPDIDGAGWSGKTPIGAEIYDGIYEKVLDTWPCDPDETICIDITFKNSQYGLVGGTSASIEKTLSKASEKLETASRSDMKPNKVQTNNFEIGGVVKNLPSMLRGMSVNIQRRSSPILDLESDELEISDSQTSQLLQQYYKNLGMNYERLNDIKAFNGITGQGESELATKIINSSAEQSVVSIEQKSNIQARFLQNLAQKNEELAKANLEQIAYNDLEKFLNQFAELERFTFAIKDFAYEVSQNIVRVDNIPEQ